VIAVVVVALEHIKSAFGSILQLQARFFLCKGIECENFLADKCTEGVLLYSEGWTTTKSSKLFCYKTAKFTSFVYSDIVYGPVKSVLILVMRFPNNPEFYS